MSPVVLLDRRGRPLVPRLKYQHVQCCGCWRLKHRDSRPHGRPLPRLDDHSTGICEECLPRLMVGIPERDTAGQSR